MRPSTFIAPCLPSKVTKPPSGSLWVHEISRKISAPHATIGRTGVPVWFL